jgi:hypothetical protein
MLGRVSIFRRLTTFVLLLAGFACRLPTDSAEATLAEERGVARRAQKAITEYSVASLDAVGTINENAKTIAVTVPSGSDITALVATFKTTGSSVKVGEVVQVSGTTANDFSDPVVYKVKALNGSTASYTVTVTVAPSSAKALTAFSFANPEATGTIDEAANTVAVTVPTGTNVTALVATFTATGASVTVGTVAQASGTTANNFTLPLTYTVTAKDDSTASYVVTVTVAAQPPSSAKAITAFWFQSPPTTGVIDEDAKTIALTVPWVVTDVSALVASFITTGVSVTVGSTAQVSGTTVNNFLGRALTYTVAAADGSTASYTVSVTPDPAIWEFSFMSPPAIAVIDQNAQTIAVSVPSGTNVTALVATFTSSGNPTVGSTVQVSGTTPNDFTSPLVYKVTAGDGSTATYTVTVTPSADSSAKALTRFDILDNFGYHQGVIDEQAKTIVIELQMWACGIQYGDFWIVYFETTGIGVELESVEQVSGEGDRFSLIISNGGVPVYRVRAADGSTADYTVLIAWFWTGNCA